MKSKFLTVIIISTIMLLFSVSYTFAASFNNAVDGVRNFVGGAENVVENAGNTVAGGIKNGMNTLGNGARNTADATKNTVGAMTAGNGGSNNGGYTATRTATGDAGMTTGIMSNTWTWVIIGITAVGIGVLMWSYFAQNRNVHSYIDSDEDDS